jgi:hypothetical protein
LKDGLKFRFKGFYKVESEVIAHFINLIEKGAHHVILNFNLAELCLERWSITPGGLAGHILGDPFL